MADKISEYISASDNANEYTDALLKNKKQQALEDIDNLMTSTAERDDELWNELGVDPELIVDDFDDVDVDDRDLDWVLGLSALSAASGEQFFLDNRDELIIMPAAYRLQKMSGFNMTQAQLIAAGKREAVEVAVQSYEALQSQYLAEYAFLKDVPSKDLYNILLESGAHKPFDKAVADASGYVSRMTSHPPGSPQFKEAVADLVGDSERALMGKNRRAVEQLHTMQQIGGDLNTLMVWILDPGSKSCEYCPQRAGEVMAYWEWVEDGLPGASVCKGGDKCNCHLAAAGF